MPGDGNPPRTILPRTPREVLTSPFFWCFSFFLFRQESSACPDRGEGVLCEFSWKITHARRMDQRGRMQSSLSRQVQELYGQGGLFLFLPLPHFALKGAGAPHSRRELV